MVMNSYMDWNDGEELKKRLEAFLYVLYIYD